VCNLAERSTCEEADRIPGQHSALGITIETVGIINPSQIHELEKDSAQKTLGTERARVKELTIFSQCNVKYRVTASGVTIDAVGGQH
jgi:hypothetical protein